ncbi:type II toxin-antitoxin system HicA family toxin [Scytonema sp. UIC 10036]|nr:type II toxin-antitoxin system HicA family toxin [Scytonema sp. UIC 10036]
MSKLPIVSGAECIKALEKIGFSVYRQRGSHITTICQEPTNPILVG